MRIDILTVVPELLQSPLNESILKRAQQKGLVEICVHNLRDYAFDKHRQVDDYPFGGEAGMVMKAEPIFLCIEELQRQRSYDEIIYTSPDGRRYDQHEANRPLDAREHHHPVRSLQGGGLPGARTSDHERAVDRRLRADRSELAAAIIADSVVRILPGAIGDGSSALTDCFQDNLLAPPVYTRPADFRGWKVPDVLLSGNFAEIEKWQEQQAFERTERLRPDLLR